MESGIPSPSESVITVTVIARVEAALVQPLALATTDMVPLVLFATTVIELVEEDPVHPLGRVQV